MTAPLADYWGLLETDEEIIAELRALDLDLSAERERSGAPATRDQAQRDALASVLMRRQADALAAVEEFEASRAAEMAVLTRRYADQIDRARRQADLLERAVEAIAEQTKRAGGFVRRQSRDVGAGTYGYRTSAAAIDVVDDAAALAWASEHAPSLVQVTIRVRLDDARERFTETELADGAARALVKVEAKRFITENGFHPEHADYTPPPGFVVRGALDTYYAKPLPAAAISGTRVR